MSILLSRYWPSALGGLCALLALTSHANNIQIANSSLTGNTGTSVYVQFDVNWENSWRGGAVTNWDAAWVFVKYRTSLTGPWLHASLNNTGHLAAAGSQIDLGLLNPGTAYNATTNPVVGVFVHRSATGTGNISLPATKLQWNFGAQALNYSDIAQVQVFAIEMVYVPQSAFAAGSGGSETGAFTLTTINTANATTAPAGTGSLGGQAGGYPTGQIAPANASWPNGFNAFYCMKYEVSQQGYVDFLNTLTYNQQVTRTATAPTSTAGTGALSSANVKRNGIDIQTPAVASTTPAVYACNDNGNTTYGEAMDGKDLPCNWLSLADLMAYLDWSGLRPMTELEFEKACRGQIAPVADEYPWGTTGLTSDQYQVANGGYNNERVVVNYNTSLGNATYNGTLLTGVPQGPIRVGVFAANTANTGRVTAGASYHGIMELGGNVWERPVTIGNVEGRAFTGTHGNGFLTGTGDPDPIDWPLTTGSGAGFRGGAWNSNASDLRVSTRLSATLPDATRRNDSGSRGVRTAP